MSLDDFEPDEYEDDEEYEEYEQSGSSESVKDKYDRYKSYKEKYDNYKEKYGNRNDIPKPDNEQFRKAANQEIRSKASGEAAKSVAKEGSKEVVKEGAKEVGKEVAKEGAKIATKEGTKVAVEAGAASTGVGIIAAAAIEVADRLLKKLKALKDKELREKEKEKARKKRNRLLFLLAFVLVVFIPVFVAGPLFVTSEESTASLEDIIEKREERYTDNLHNNYSDTSNIYRKTLMMFTKEEYKELLFKNYDKIEGSKPTAYEDPSYNFTIKNDFGTDIINFFSKQEDLKDKDEFEVSTKVVRNFVEAEMRNFNKITWSASKGLDSYTVKTPQTFTSISDMESNDVKPTRSPYISLTAIEQRELQYIPYTQLKIPKLELYDTDPSNPNVTEKAYTYAQAADSYVQKWFIPYTMMIDTQDKDFIINEVIEKMYHPIDFTLYQINREDKVTTIQYYLETSVKKTWDEYEEVHVTTTTYPIDPVTGLPSTVPSTSTSVTTTTPQQKEEDLGTSNTRDSTVGEEALPEEASREQVYSDTSSDGTVTVTKFLIKTNYKKITTLTDGGKIAKDSNGEPMVKGITITRNIYPYRYVPKITHAETFYEVINATYSVMPIDETLPPRTSNQSALSVSADSSYGTTVLSEMWEENLATGSYVSKPYKVSYYTDEDLKKLNKKVSRVEWYQDWGDEDTIVYSSDINTSIGGTNTGGDTNPGTITTPSGGTAAATSENMTRMLQQAETMVGQQYWVYGQGGDRGVAYSLDTLYGKRNIDCSSFVSSLYNIFLGVNPGSNTTQMHDKAKSLSDGFRLYDLDASQLQPGDILWRKGHVGLYIGNGMQIDAGGPSGVAEPNRAGIGRAYTHIIRYEGADFSDVEVPSGGGSSGTTGTTGTTGSIGSSGHESDVEIDGIYPGKSMAERAAAYESYGNGKGYSYDDMYFAYYQIESRLRKIANQNGSGSLSGLGGAGFGWPVEITSSNPRTNVINCFYGYTPAYGDDHDGLDISSGGNIRREGNLSIGPNIVAAHSGIVIAASGNPTSDTDGYTYVNIKTEDGSYVTQYGHLSKIYVSVGDTVSKGQVIGLMGTTGRSTGVHLHFVVMDSSGNRMNPLNFYNIAKASAPDTIVNHLEIDLMSITNIPTGYIYHSPKGSGTGEGGAGGTGGTGGTGSASSDLKSYIRGWENPGGSETNADGTKYIIFNDGAGNPTVGYGILINAERKRMFEDAGYPTHIGGEIPVSVVDVIEDDVINTYLNDVKSRTAGLNLKDYQIHALVSRSYNCGVAGALGKRGSMDFVASYKAYWTASDNNATQVNLNHPLYTNYMSKPNTSKGVVQRGLVIRREKEWALFQTGVYDNGY